MLNDDRSKEFKYYDKDGQFTLRKMREHAGRCVCGFLNSQQSGMLLIGVTEEGTLSSVMIWASSRQNLSSGFPSKRDSNRSPQLQRLARISKFCL